MGDGSEVSIPEGHVNSSMASPKGEKQETGTGLVPAAGGDEAKEANSSKGPKWYD